MKNLNIALRSLFKKGRSNGIKILSLGVGLAMGLVLISKVCFERSFDKFYPDSDRIYRFERHFLYCDSRYRDRYDCRLLFRYGMVGEIYGKGAHRIFHLPGRSDDGLCFDHCLCPVPCMGRFEF